ncbi:siderophore-interacting protein [Paraglaciecola aquimarina]|uniref:Siderophore-interacting protein n=1 Tax=Paraglaciecola aquimarina TaxID=1235557 RepID=A0ABU3T2E6_9ALTE|nr:siderophore-interacting protein [Paraglaciecola aquimarina]MDU0356441.1 siderophore-interacting protein [Paraglaciecola aquimarina]
MGPKMRMSRVVSVVDLSPHMKRIIVTGEELTDISESKKSAHVKAIFPHPDDVNKMPRLGLYFGFKKYMRSYTIRAFDKQSLQLTLDFAVNDHQGLASNWAANAQVGDHLGIAGPGDTKHTDLNADKHLFFGDFTALPAIAATLEMLPKQAQGRAWIQVPEQSDIQQFNGPDDVEINWLVTPNKLSEEFLTALASQPKQLKDTAIFIAAEAQVVRQLKAYLNDHCDYDKKRLYASAYWRSKKVTKLVTFFVFQLT